MKADLNAPSEDAIHRSVAQTLSLCIARPGECSPLGVVWFSIEHRIDGGARLHAIQESQRRAARGVVPGVPDLCILYGGLTLWIELKGVAGRLSAHQKMLHPALRGAGHRVEVCRSIEDVIAALVLYGIPHIKVRT